MFKTKFKLDDVIWYLDDKLEIQPAQIEKIRTEVSVDEKPKTMYCIGGFREIWKEEKELFKNKEELFQKKKKPIKIKHLKLSDKNA